MKYAIDLTLIFSSITNAVTFFSYLNGFKSDASPELNDTAPSLSSNFNTGDYSVISTYRLVTEDERKNILTYILSNESKILKGIVKTHDCYHDEGGSCEKLETTIIGDFKDE